MQGPMICCRFLTARPDLPLTICPKTTSCCPVHRDKTRDQAVLMAVAIVIPTGSLTFEMTLWALMGLGLCVNSLRWLSGLNKED
ncbi:hypothetical protein BDV59DRAFT_176476 [Aspergillus ambiguus]|uniref:uncharacterized protein n=1 Tax=Aspergillus ambiguus TaxID=176160 RepID=UPI003CCDBE5F